jgi:amino acid permease
VGRSLTTFQAACLIAGAGIGTGILGLPLAAQGVGIAGILAALAGAFLASLLLYFMMSELTRRSDPPVQLLTILTKHLFTGRWGNAFRMIFFGLFTFLLIENLTAYVVAAGDALASLGVPASVAQIAFSVVAGVVGAFGLRTVAHFETLSVILIAIVVATLTGLALANPIRSVTLGLAEPVGALRLFALFIYSFSAIFAVVQAAGHVSAAADLKKALVIGLTINAAAALAFTYATLTASQTVTAVGTVGLAESLNYPGVRVGACVFILLGMLTSYWPSLIAFADVAKEAFSVPPLLGQQLAAVPALLIALLLPLNFLDYIMLGAGAVSLVVILLIIPAYRHAIQHADPALPPLIGRQGGGTFTLVAMGLVGVAMTIGSLV